MEVAPYAWLKQNLNDKGEEISFYVINVADPTRSLNKRRRCKVNKRSPIVALALKMLIHGK